MRKGTLKKALALALTGAVLVGAFAGCGAKKDSGDKKETKKIVIGASPSPHADILKVAKKELKKEGYELEIKEYSDYVQPNTALESGDLDANYFQHKPYLDDLNKMYTTSKYDTAIKFLKFWSVFILFAMFAYGYSSIGRYEYMTFR